jgi:Leucine-rich repeat (LRR) protein
VKAHKYAQRLIAKIKNSSDRVRKEIMGLMIDRLDDGEFYTDITDIINLFGVDFLLKNTPGLQMTKLLEVPNSIFDGLILQYGDKVITIDNREILDLSDNKISDLSKFEGLHNFTDVTKMKLDDNQITEILGLDILQDLQEISVENNKIKEIKGFEQFPKLVKLNLQNNQIRELKGLKNLKNLKTIDLSQNCIVEIDCRELPKVESIDLTDNLIMKIKNITSSSKFVFSYKVNNRIAVNLEDKQVRITIDNDASIILKNHSVFIEKNGLLRQHTVLDKVYSGFTEFTPVKSHSTRKKTKVHLTKVYPLGIDKTKNELEGHFREICSSLQLWAENEYDIRLLREDLVFPLMEELGQVKDSVSKKVLEEFESYNKGFEKPEHPEQENNSVAIVEQPFFVAEEYFSKEKVRESLRGTTLKRKLFNTANNDLLGVLYFKDFHDVEIKLLTPEAKPIREVSEEFIRIFLKGALIKIKEENPAISLEYTFFKNSDILERIKISNVRSIHDYDLITDKMQELLVAT